MRKFTLSLLILVFALWAVISVYWTGTKKNQTKTEENPSTSTLLSPATLLVSSDSANVATLSSPTIRVTTTGKPTLK